MTQPRQRMVTITLGGNSDFDGFDCRGRVKSLCDGCRLRFLCLSERDEIQIPQEVVKQNKIKDLRSVVKYMFSEGRIPYEIGEHKRTNPSGETETRLVMRVKNGR
jgi:hypothetical protein